MLVASISALPPVAVPAAGASADRLPATVPGDLFAALIAAAIETDPASQVMPDFQTVAAAVASPSVAGRPDAPLGSPTPPPRLPRAAAVTDPTALLNAMAVAPLPIPIPASEPLPAPRALAPAASVAPPVEPNAEACSTLFAQEAPSAAAPARPFDVGCPVAPEAAAPIGRARLATAPETDARETTPPITARRKDTDHENTGLETAVFETTAFETTRVQTTAAPVVAPEAVAPGNVPTETAAPETTAPKTAVSGSVAPETAAPKPVAPSSVASNTATPKHVESDSVAPKGAEIETARPKTAAPESVATETAAPETTAPKTAVSGSVAPETAVPQTTVPQAVAPETAYAPGIPVPARRVEPAIRAFTAWRTLRSDAPLAPAGRSNPEAFTLDLKPAARTLPSSPATVGIPALPTFSHDLPDAGRAEAPGIKSDVKQDAAPEKPHTPEEPAPHRQPLRESQAGRDDRRQDDRERPSNRASEPAAVFEKVAPVRHAEASAASARPLTDLAAPAVRPEPVEPRLARAPEPVTAPASAVEEPVEDGTPGARPAQEIALRLGSSGESKVEVRVSERAGEVHVSVRTPDATLARAMREDLGSLTGRLAQAGYESAATSNDQQFSGRQQEGRRDSSGGQRDGSASGGSGSQQQQQRQQQDDSRGRRFAWLDSLSEFLSDRTPTGRIYDDATR